MKKEQATRGAFWMLVELGGGRVLSLACFIVLARILGPDDFGVFTIANAVISAMSYVLTEGFAAWIVQRPKIDDTDLATAFWTNLTLAAILVGATVAGAPWIAQLFHAPALAPVLRLLSFVWLLMALSTTQIALLRRRLDFSIFAVRTVIGYAVGGGGAVLMALNGWGILSLVMVQVGQCGTTLIIVWWLSSWRPKFLFSASSLRNLISFSVRYASGSCVTLLTAKLDILILGAFLDSAAVGHYTLSLRVVDTATALTINPIWVVMMPVLSRMTEVPLRFSEVFVRAVVAATMVSVPLMIGLGGLSPIFIPLIFGVQWQQAAAILQAMAPVGFALGLVSLSGPALSARGRPGDYLKLAIVGMVLAAIIFTIAARFGAVAVGLAFSLIPALIAPLHLFVLQRVCDIEVKRLLQALLPILIGGCLMAAWMWLWRSNWIVSALGGMVLYVATLEFLSRSVSDHVKLINETFFRRGTV